MNEWMNEPTNEQEIAEDGCEKKAWKHLNNWNDKRHPQYVIHTQTLSAKLHTKYNAERASGFFKTFHINF